MARQSHALVRSASAGIRRGEDRDLHVLAYDAAVTRRSPSIGAESSFLEQAFPKDYLLQ